MKYYAKIGTFNHLPQQHLMKSKIRIGILAVGTLVVLGSGAWLYVNAGTAKRSDVAAIGKLTKSERLERAQSKLQEVSRKPQGTSVALISFDQLNGKEHVKDLIAQHDLKVKWVYFTIPVSKGPTTQGGFAVNDDLETSFKDHEKNLLASFETSGDYLVRIYPAAGSDDHNTYHFIAK